MFHIEILSETYRPFVNEQIVESWAGPFVVTKGVLHDTRTHAGFVAVDNGAVTGYILYHLADGNCEITVLESLLEGHGIGKALMHAVLQMAQEANCRRLWLITTNDNTHAIRFYQRLGYTLCAVHLNAIKESRKLKPQIPLLGEDEIPILHEFEFEKLLV